MSDLRDRIVAVLDKALPASAWDVGFYQRINVTPLVDIEAYDLNLELVADAVIAELDDMGVIHLSKVIHINKVIHDDETD